MGDGGGLAQWLQITEELELTIGVGLLDSLRKEAAEQAAEHTYREKESRKASFPLALGRQSAARNDTVQMGMPVQVLSPGMQRGEETDLRAQVLGVRAMVSRVSATVRNRM